MAVNTPHPDYDHALANWLRIREVIAGEDAVKAAGERYLPRVLSQTDDEYNLYRQRASFFNATARTAEGYLGLIFRRPPFIKLPESVVGTRSTASPSGNDSATVSAQRSGLGGVRPFVQSSELDVGSSKFSPPNPQPPHQSSLDRALTSFLNDADLLGTSFPAYAKAVTSEIVTVGRAGSLVDWENDAENRAYVVLYHAENILNWRVERVNGRRVPTLVSLREWARPFSAAASNFPGDPNPFAGELVEQIRILKLVHPSLVATVGTQSPASQTEPLSDTRLSTLDSGHLLCLVEIWQKQESKSTRRKPEWQLVNTVIPLRLGRPLPFIPFVFHGPRHSRPDIDQSPLTHIVAVNLDHYRLDADYKHGLHYTALPTAWVSGFERSSTLKIGSSTAWVTELPGASAGFLEFHGHGLTSFERALDRDERLMAVLGSRLLEDQKKVGETAQAIELRQSGENSILSSLAASLSDSLTQVLRWVYWWNSTADSPDAITESQALVRLNTDFSLKGMSSDELHATVHAWQNGAISRDTMFELFRKGEILPDGRTNSEESRLIASAHPPLPAKS